MINLIINENQLNKLIDNIITETKKGPIEEYISKKSEIYSEHYGSSTKKRVSHELLETNFGLPSGSTYENYYYSANLSDVVNASISIPRDKFLSIFRPISPYNKDKKAYSDIFIVNDASIINSGIKTYNLSQNGVIYASHNGLLALTRAMNGMKGEIGYMTIELNAKGEDGNNIIFDLNTSINPSSIFRGIQSILIKFVINPNFFERMKIDFTNKKSPQEIKQNKIIENLIINFIIGKSTYLKITDEKLKNEIIKNLESKGMITNIDFNINNFFNELLILSKENDFINNKTINSDKAKKISNISKKYQTELLDKMKNAYLHNLKLFVTNYLPNYSKTILPKLSNVNFKMDDLSIIYNDVFSSHGVESNQNISTGQINTYKFKEGG